VGVRELTGLAEQDLVLQVVQITSFFSCSVCVIYNTYSSFKGRLELHQWADLKT
jgi:hypothetical protein